MAVSPPGADLSEPVTHTTHRVVTVFWSLDASLAYARHFPAINWLTSYSLYLENIEDYLRRTIGPEWIEMRVEAMRILQEESELEEIVRLVGMDALSVRERFTLETARSIREDFLHQNAFHEIDTYTSLEKQAGMLHLILLFHSEGLRALEREVDLDEILVLPVRERIARAKYVEEAKVKETFAQIEAELKEQIAALVDKGGEESA